MYPPDYEPEEPAFVECHDCDGNGYTGEGGEHDCPTCEGRGELPNPDLSEHTQTQLLLARASGDL